ncbi:post-GPI attachment to proteins factor 2-like [Cephus cinctus]|uniref:Post-GPI attachment to proteins factor 2-like n=1 Tax=Cephus cinctus TaxID=211228 RepID=A0AAJ7CBH3_CEPCN|nr:post-GPI attachment to proteins factor 2-like [Cephus cinctus]
MMHKIRFDPEYSPLVKEESSRYRIVLPFSKVAWFTVSLPFVAFLFCIGWSILYNFEHATSTHCKVYNFLPSVSAAIGHYRPQKDVWKAAIALQATIRVLVLVMYFQYYKETVHSLAQGLSNIALMLYIIENTALVTLSFWSSDENYAFHKLSFITFLITSLVHMVLTCLIMKHYRNISRNALETDSLKLKWRFLFFNVASILMACYFFYRHNKYCEPLVYSMFALTEYMVVISNMGFHVTAAWDFAGRSLLISGNGLRIV